MTITAKIPFQSHHGAPLDDERGLVAHLIQAATEAGVQASSASIVNFYVALKSKPLTILAGPAGSGKIALVNSLARVLTGGDPFQYQAMTGHAWWAAQTGNVALFTEGQMRLNTWKILGLVEEALQPENADQVFIACLNCICPAEVMGFFSEVAFQLWHGQIMRLPAVHLTEPIPWPPNLFMIGTMDTSRFDWWDEDLLSRTTVIQWPAAKASSASFYAQTPAISHRDEDGFLRACVRNGRAACVKLRRIQGIRLASIRSLFLIEYLLRMHAVPLPQSVLSEAIVYLANAWSGKGIGLFDQATSRNRAIALDLAIAQTILPRVAGAVRRSAALRKQLEETLKGRFPHSLAFLRSTAQVSAVHSFNEGR